MTFLVTMLAILLLAVGLSAAPRPNFVVVLADDIGYGDLGSYGNTQIRTPNLDRMAAEGVQLTNFYAAPICTPSRAMLLTGRYPIRSGLVRVLHPGEEFGMPDSEITLAEALKDQGYATGLIGKWHLGSRRRFRPLHHGFDYFYGLLYSHNMTILQGNLRRLQLFRGDHTIEWPVDLNNLTREYIEESQAFIERNKDGPFFLYLAHSMPHVPVHASEAFRGKSARGIYGDAVEEIDWGMGEILATLQKLGLDENTLVIFTSDNGPAVGRGAAGGSAGPFRGGKHTTWEGGVREPFIARWPGHIRGGLVEDGIASIMDLYPTLIELAGGEIPSDRPIDGKNILAMLEGEGESPHSTLIYYVRRQITAIRSGDWKLHFFKVAVGRLPLNDFKKCDPPELYNLAEDPAEEHNVALDHPDIIARLKSQAEEFRKQVEPGELPPRRWLIR